MPDPDTSSPPAAPAAAAIPAAPSPPTLLDTLRLVASDAALPHQLASICHLIEHERSGCRASILVLDGTRLRHGAAPSLDPDYCDLVDGIEIGPAVGSCGTAAFHGCTTIVSEIATDPRWAGFAGVAARFGLGACWSEPIRGPLGEVLGTFAIYRAEPGAPEPEDLATLHLAADVARVVLERDHRRRELDETRSWLHLALDAARAGLWDWDVPTGQVKVSPGYLGMLGLEHDGRPVDTDWFLESLHPEDRETAVATIDRQVADLPGVVDLHFRMQAADGSYRWIHSTGRVVGRAADGSATRVIGQHVDDTQRRTIEQRERELSERLLKISTTAPAMFHQFRIDADGRASFPYVSDAVTALFGVTRDAVLEDADVLYGRVHPDDLGGVWAVTRRSHARMEPWRHEFRVRRDDGSVRWLLGHATPERGLDGSVIWHGYMSDITAQKALEERLIQASEAASEASRAKSAFITNLSHELRTPLTAILGFVDLVDQGVIGTDAASRADAMRTIRRNGESLLEVIDDMLELARLESRRMPIEFMATDPRQVVDEVVEAERPQAEAKGLILDVIHDTPVPEFIETDGGRLRQALGQLLDNAIKFTPRGRVTVRLAVLRADGQDGEERLTITVEDTGIGMSERELEAAFDAFTQADASLTRAHGGAGLGLRIAQSLARMLGGELRATARPGEGSRFTLSLAVEQPAGAAMPTTADALATPATAPTTATASAGAAAVGDVGGAIAREAITDRGAAGPHLDGQDPGPAEDASGDQTRAAMQLIASMDPATPGDFGVDEDEAAPMAGTAPTDGRVGEIACELWGGGDGAGANAPTDADADADAAADVEDGHRGGRSRAA